MLQLSEGAFIKGRFQARATAQTGQSAFAVVGCAGNGMLRLGAVRFTSPYDLKAVFNRQVARERRHQPPMLDEQAFLAVLHERLNIVARDNGGDAHRRVICCLRRWSGVIATGWCAAIGGAIVRQHATHHFLYDCLHIRVRHASILSSFAGRIPARNRRSPVAFRSSSRSTIRAKTLTWPKGVVSP